MFRTHDLLLQPGIVHGFFGRKGGLSDGIYESLNCGLGSKDDPDLVMMNRRRACEELELDPDKLVGLWQVHGDSCIVADTPWSNDERPHADAMVTDMPGMALSILTADCAPVLFAGRKKDGWPVVGAAHAGWGGALKGILESTCMAMVKKGAVLDGIAAAVGPCIGPQSYEVKEEFAEPFLNHSGGSGQFFHESSRKGALFFDLPGYVKRRLELMGVRTVGGIGHDTYAMDKDYFSYRRSVHRKEPDYGRQISMIAIAPYK